MHQHRGRPPIKKTIPAVNGATTVSEREDDRMNMKMTREEERLSVEDVDLRKRGVMYDLPDYDNMHVSDAVNSFNLNAPEPRVDKKYGKMRQYWCNPNMNNKGRLPQMIKQGWRLRHPSTVDPSFPFVTEKWDGNDVISVAGEMILMEIPEFYYKKMEQRLVDANNRIINEISSHHGDIMRDGKWESDAKLQNVHKFSEETIIQRNRDSEGISFAE